ncbi:hypothetical protein BDR06DRAFT_889213, partial [Suillus hirtellus]
VIHTSGLPKNLWREGIKHAVYVKNQSFMCSLKGKMPYEMLTGKKLYLGDLLVWGAKVWVHNPTGPKLDMHACMGCWIGFDAKSGVHRIYFEDYQNIAVEQNVSFDK